jgi:hypothetical protein
MLSMGPKVALLAAAVVVSSVSLAAADDLGEAVREQRRNRIEAAGLPARLSVGGERICAAVALPQFYERPGLPAGPDAGGCPHSPDI